MKLEILVFYLIAVCSISCSDNHSTSERKILAQESLNNKSNIKYKRVEFNVREKRGKDNHRIYYVEHGSLCLIFLAGEGGSHLKILNNNKQISSWIYGGFLEFYSISDNELFYSSELNDYYLCLAGGEDEPSFGVIHIDENKVEELGYFYSNETASKADNINIWDTHTLAFQIKSGKPTLSLNDNADKEVFYFNQIRAVTETTTLDKNQISKFDSLDKFLPFSNPYKIQKSLCFSDDACLDFEIKWKEKQIEFKNTSIENQWHVFFKSDTLIIMDIKTYKPYLHKSLRLFFTYSPRHAAIVLCKMIYDEEAQPYYDDACEFTEVYTNEQLKNTTLEYFSNENIERLDRKRNEDYYRDFNLSELLKRFKGQFGPTGSYFPGCTELPSPDEMHLVFKKEPLSDKNIEDYLTLIHYFQIIGNKLKGSKLGRWGDIFNEAHEFAIHIALDIEQKYPDKAILYKYLGDSNWELNRKDKAKFAYEKFISLVKVQSSDKLIVPSYVYDRLK